MNKIKKTLFLTIIMCCMLQSTISAATENPYKIIPYPQSLVPASGMFQLRKQTTLKFDAADTVVSRLAIQFARQFRTVSGLSLQASAGTSASVIEFVQGDSTKLGNEAYRLQVTPSKIRIEAASPNGFFYALQTLYQLMPEQIYGQKQAKGINWTVPCCTIEDKPRFAYRGLHLDVCRHFFPLEFIKKYIDAMAIHKLNTFHWHLTDDQGWRIEIKKYPLLTQTGAYRKEIFPGNAAEVDYGGYYTQAEAREVVEYARQRCITVIPEIEMPGHAVAALAAYPNLSCTRKPLKVHTTWGIFDDVYCPRDSTFSFLEDVLTEIMAIFPSHYIHIGGDECPKTRWKACPDCQARIKSLGLKDENELQAYFIERIEKFLNARGREIIGWDEILEGGLAPNATVMSWRGIQGGVTAAMSGHKAVMTPGDFCYLDKYQADPSEEPKAIGGFLPLGKAYQYEPVPSTLDSLHARFILGAQGNVWTEYIHTSDRVEYMAFPRVAALAEVLWTGAENRNPQRFMQNMRTQFARYDVLGINACRVYYDVQLQISTPEPGQTHVTLLLDNPKAEIRYTTDGSTPTAASPVYTTPLVLTKSTTIKAQAFESGKLSGRELERFCTVRK